MATFGFYRAALRAVLSAAELTTSGCDLTPLDYYLWGAVKGKCYADKPETINVLKDNISETIGEIHLHTIDNELKNWTDHVGSCMAIQGNYFPLLTGKIVLLNKK